MPRGARTDLIDGEEPVIPVLEDEGRAPEWMASCKRAGMAKSVSMACSPSFHAALFIPWRLIKEERVVSLSTSLEVVFIVETEKSSSSLLVSDVFCGHVLPIEQLWVAEASGSHVGGEREIHFSFSFGAADLHAGQLILIAGEGRCI